MEKIVKEIEDTIEKSINDFFEGKDVKTTHVLDILFPIERRIRSLIGGLETSMGTRVWEPLAKLFAASNGYTILNEKDFNKAHCLKNPPHWALNCLNKWKHKRETTEVSLDKYIEEMRTLAKQNPHANLNWTKAKKGSGVDVWVKKGNTEYLFDIKTNQINAGGGPKFNENIMLWYMYRILKNPNINVKCMIAFPFNPHPGSFWSKEKGKSFPLIPSHDALVEDEFWNLLSGQDDTWKTIVSAFETLSSKGFDQKFHSILYK